MYFGALNVRERNDADVIERFISGDNRLHVDSHISPTPPHNFYGGRVIRNAKFGVILAFGCSF